MMSWLCWFCDPVASAPLMLARPMSVFRESICLSRLFTWFTSSLTLPSTLAESWLIWVFMRSASSRKFWTVVTAWPRNRLEDGSLAAEAKAAEIWSGMLKK